MKLQNCRVDHGYDLNCWDYRRRTREFQFFGSGHQACPCHSHRRKPTRRRSECIERMTRPQEPSARPSCQKSDWSD